MICLIFIAAELQNNQIKTVILIILYLHVFLVSCYFYFIFEVRYRKVKFVSGQELLPKALEILLSQEVLYQLSYPERIDLMRSILKGKDRTEISTLFLTGQIMYGVYFLPLIEDLKSDEILSAFLETSASGQIDGRQLDIINTNAELFCTYQNDNFEDYDQR
ncbi:hypothetical protein [Parabacteroides sp.]